ncbi:uncharacterized protein [Typha latifolia]|uniref:uncharacterized protein n=1 Tax=Typha latifolia TaxID=4733 RepID=UPI003C2F17E7
MHGSKKYSQSEVSIHTSKKDCWVVIHGKVYDVTTFLEDHPGGEDALLQASASGDATNSFEEVGHSTSAISMMENYLIGAIEGYTAKSEGGRKTMDLGEAARAKRMQESNQPSYTFFDYLLPLLVLGLAFVAWYYLTFYSEAKA